MQRMDADEKQDKENGRLAQFHHTISEQLNARLEESTKFFGLLIVVSTGYGYVLSTPVLCSQRDVFVLASFLAYGTVLWLTWYLAALGYAFRFLQNSQHLIEHALGWSPAYVPGPQNGRVVGEPPESLKLKDSFWLLPGIYHAHAAGLSAFLVVSNLYSLWVSRLGVVGSFLRGANLFSGRLVRIYLGILDKQILSEEVQKESQEASVAGRSGERLSDCVIHTIVANCHLPKRVPQPKRSLASGARALS